MSKITSLSGITGDSDGAAAKNSPAHIGDAEDMGLNPWVRKIPWRRKWQPTPVFLPGTSHGQRRLVGCSP